MAAGPISSTTPVSTADLTAVAAPLATSAGVTSATSPLATSAGLAAAMANLLVVRRIDASLARSAGTYDLVTATGGDMWIEIEAAQVTVAAAGLTSALLITDHATPKTLVASVLLASLTLDSLLTVAIPKFLLPSGKKLRLTIVGTGSAGNIAIIAKIAPASAGATLV